MFDKKYLRDKGFHEGPDGNWYANKQKSDELWKQATPKVAKNIRNGNSDEVSQSERNVRLRAEGEVETEKRIQGSNHFRIICIAYCHRHRDPDNLCPKGAIDALVDAGIIPDDSSKYITGGILKLVRVIPKTEQERTVIRIYERAG